MSGTNLCTGGDFNCTPSSANASFYQSLVTNWESGNRAVADVAIDNDIRNGILNVQTVTASGTLFTTGAAHNFTAGASDIIFCVTGGTSYSGVPMYSALNCSQTYNVDTTPSGTTFTMKAYSGGQVTGTDINAGSAGSGTMTVGYVNAGGFSMWYMTSWSFAMAEATVARYNAVGVKGMAYEGNLEPQGLSGSQCTSLGITGTNCSGSIAAAITHWKMSMGFNTEQDYLKQFIGTYANAYNSLGGANPMTNVTAPSQLVLMGGGLYGLLSGNSPISSPYQMFYGYSNFNRTP